MLLFFSLFVSICDQTMADLRRRVRPPRLVLRVIGVTALFTLCCAGFVTNARAVDTGPLRTAFAQGTDGGNAPRSPYVVVGGGLEAGTEQAAASSASASQQQPTNIVVSVRINSPGDDGPITQTNVVVADSGASNSATTSQAGSGVGGAAPDEEAATGQQAAATATATQDAAGNLVVVVRINSPGNNGAVSQANGTVAVADAGNTASTEQGSPTPEASDPASAPVAAPRARPSAAKTKGTRVGPRRTRQMAAPVDSREPAPTVSAPASSAPAAAPAPALQPDSAAAAHPVAKKRAHAAVRSHAPVHRTTGAAGLKVPQALGTVADRAGDLLRTAAPKRAAAPASADVSGAVFFSLLGVLAVAGAAAVWSRLGRGFGVVRPEGRSHR